MHIDREPAARNERAEAGGHRGNEVARPELAMRVDAPDLPIGEHVPDVGQHLCPEGGREPDGVDRPQPRRDLTEAGDPRDREKSAEGDDGRRNDEHERLRSGSFHVALTGERRHRYPPVTQARMH